MQESKVEIKVQDLVKSFPRQGGSPLIVLDKVEFDVKKGEFVTLLGPTGCGKTTALKIIAGIEKPDRGKVETHVSTIGHIPIVWQEHRLFPWRTVLKNVTFPLELEKDMRIDKARQKGHEILRLMGLENFESYYPRQISGGMAERVAIGRALINDPSCMLMDEPFASVDYQTKQILFRQVQELRMKRELTILYVTHDLRDAIQFSDRIVVLSKAPAKVREIIKCSSNDLPRSELEEHLWDLLR